MRDRAWNPYTPMSPPRFVPDFFSTYLCAQICLLVSTSLLGGEILRSELGLIMSI